MRLRTALAIFGLYLVILVLSGCETVKGAALGFTKDWENAKKADSWIRENLW